MDEVDVRTDADGDRVVVTAAGEFDFYSAPRLRDALLGQIAGAPRLLVVDLRGVTFMDSSALGVLVGAMKQLRRHDGSMQLVCADERILKIFRITGLAKVFTIRATLDDALE
jgi:anti-sigma B factor antagonist